MFQFILNLFRAPKEKSLLSWLKRRVEEELLKLESAKAENRRELEVSLGGKVRGYMEVIDYVKTHKT